MSIKTPEDLKKAIEIAKNGTKEEKISIISDIGTYKWYNYYCNMHIEKGCKEDLENEKIFEQVEKEDPELHILIEQRVEMYILRLENDIDD